MIIDESFGYDGYSYELIRLYLAEGRIVRVRVRRHADQQQSLAVADVLTPVLTWTELAEAPASSWHEATPPRRAATAGVLAPIADRLLTRAAVILSRHATGPH